MPQFYYISISFFKEWLMVETEMFWCYWSSLSHLSLWIYGFLKPKIFLWQAISVSTWLFLWIWRSECSQEGIILLPVQYYWSPRPILFRCPFGRNCPSFSSLLSCIWFHLICLCLFLDAILTVTCMLPSMKIKTFFY